MVWRTLFIMQIRAMEGPTPILRARRTGSPITGFYFNHMPKYADSATGNQPGASPGWAADGSSGDSGLVCVSGWPRPGSPAQTGGWGASGASRGWGSASAPNNGGWGAPASAAARGGGGWGSARGDRGGAANDDQLDAEARLERASMPTQARPGLVNLPRRPGEGNINSRSMQNDGQGRGPFVQRCVLSWANPATQQRWRSNCSPHTEWPEWGFCRLDVDRWAERRTGCRRDKGRSPWCSRTASYR